MAIGHQDLVGRWPEDAVRLASSDLVENEAYCFAGKPIYCTQFHPELDCVALLERVRAYPQYVQRIAGTTMEQFCRTCRDTPESARLLPRFVRHVFGRAP